MMWLRKSKKGFTLIELMVVVAIIGVLALLGLRLYTGQQDKAKSAIVIANASTVHTLIQGDLLDNDYSSEAGAHATGATGVIASIGGTIGGNPGAPADSLANMKNPFLGTYIVRTGVPTTHGLKGEVVVTWVANNKFEIQGIGETDHVTTGTKMTAQK